VPALAVDLVKTRMQVAGSPAAALAGGLPRSGAAAVPVRGLFGTAAYVVQANGVMGLFNGVRPALLRQATYVHPDQRRPSARLRAR
jgi:hypothetical protein